MKNYKEIAESVFERSGDIIKQKKEKRKAFAKVAYIAAPCCVVLVLAISVWVSGILDAPIGSDIELPIGSDGDSSQEINPDADIVGDGTNVGPDDNGEGFTEWNDKNITMSLWKTLQDAKDSDVLKISIQSCINEISYKEFVYNGKTLEEYEMIPGEIMEKAGKLELLIKQGDELKYGEALYTTGTPSGIKWTEKNYFETLEFYGQEILDKYIVDGIFYSESVAEDLELIYNEAQDARNEYQRARGACMSYSLERAKAELREWGVEAELSSSGGLLILSVTVKELADMSLGSYSGWMFDLYRESAESGDQNGDVPSDDVAQDSSDVIGEVN